MGANDLEEAKVNSVLDALLDFRTAFYNNAFEKDETKKVRVGILRTPQHGNVNELIKD